MSTLFSATLVYIFRRFSNDFLFIFPEQIFSLFLQLSTKLFSSFICLPSYEFCFVYVTLPNSRTVPLSLSPLSLFQEFLYFLNLASTAFCLNLASFIYFPPKSIFLAFLGGVIFVNIQSRHYRCSSRHYFATYFPAMTLFRFIIILLSLLPLLLLPSLH